MTKQKWYKSKGGWIGVIISILFMLISVNKSFDYSEIFQSLGLPFFSLGITGSFETYTLLLGFLIGYSIEKWFFKRRR